MVESMGGTRFVQFPADPDSGYEGDTMLSKTCR
jgi:hypothetical protein